MADVLVGRLSALELIVVEQPGPRLSLNDRGGFKARFSASWMPELAPRAPNGETWWAASPTKMTRPCTKRSSRRQLNR